MTLKDIEMWQNLRHGLRTIAGNWDVWAEQQKLVARSKRVFYNACIEEGFTEDEAIRLTAEYDPFRS